MLEIYIKLLPVFAWFGLGVLLKTFKVARDEHGARLLKIMFFITLPILVMVKLTETELDPEKIYLPLTNIGINLCCLAVMLLLTRKMGIPRGILGVMLVSSMVINNFFMFPFILTVLGDAALVDAMIFDIGNAVTTLTVAYALAFHYGPEELHFGNILINVIRLPALWAVTIALILNVNDLHLPAIAVRWLEPVGLLTNPFILLALGIYFSLKIEHPRLLLMTIGIRMLLGALVAFGFVVVFDLQGVSAIVVILCGAAPIGFNGLTFSSLAKLDMAFASSAVSLSLLVGLLVIPLLLFFLQTWFTISP